MYTPDYLTMVDINISFGPGEPKFLPAGSFVRPIQYAYVPQHVKDRECNKWFDKETETYCYTHFGITPIANSKMRRVGSG